MPRHQPKTAKAKIMRVPYQWPVSHLKEASNRFLYHRTILYVLAEARRTGIFGANNVLNSATLEALLLHIRILLEFLYNDNVSKDREKEDVRAVQFFSGSDWPNKRPPMSADLRKSRDRLNKELAHLTLVSFLNVENSGWDTDAILNELLPAVEMFYTTMPRPLAGGDWTEVDLKAFVTTEGIA